MPYIGKNLVGILKDARASDTMTGDGSDTTLTLTDTPGSTNNVLVFLDGIRQTPVTDYWVTGRNLTFTTAPEAGVLVVALTGSASSIDPKIGSVTSSKIVNGMVGNAKIATLSASKLTGALPAISGAALTNVVSSTGIDNVNSDPTISTNPAGGVGTIQLNQVSGEMYVCTDATAGSNVWINVGSGSGDYGGAFGGRGPGTVAGFTVGSYGGSVIDKFPFSSDADATDHGDLSLVNIGIPAGQSSTTHGYSSGGQTPAVNNLTTIEKFAFSANVTATVHGDLTVARRYIYSGQSSISHGYASGGALNGGPFQNVIDKFAFSADATATDVGNLTVSRELLAGQSSGTHGFASGGHASAYMNQIDKFSFSSDGDSVDHGDLIIGRYGVTGQSSTTHGYTCGGTRDVTPNRNEIDRFSFASNVTATDVGNLTIGKRYAAGQSSTTHGYNSGGHDGSVTLNIIDKFAYSSSVDATDIGDITVARSSCVGSQY